MVSLLIQMMFTVFSLGDIRKGVTVANQLLGFQQKLKMVKLVLEVNTHKFSMWLKHFGLPSRHNQIAEEIKVLHFCSYVPYFCDA